MAADIFVFKSYRAGFDCLTAPYPINNGFCFESSKRSEHKVDERRPPNS